MSKKESDLDILQLNGANPVPEPSPAPTPGGGLDLDSLRLSQDFSASLNVKKAIITVPVRKPHRQWFIRVRAGEDWRLQTGVIELNEERETYLVDRSLWSELAGEVIPKVLLSSMNRQGVFFLWPVRLPGMDGRIDEWNGSALTAADMATREWVSVRANMSLGAYEVFESHGDFEEPEWPDLTFQRIVEIAFKDKFIRSLDHPVLRKLRGEA